MSEWQVTVPADRWRVAVTDDVFVAGVPVDPWRVRVPDDPFVGLVPADSWGSSIPAEPVPGDGLPYTLPFTLAA